VSARVLIVDDEPPARRKLRSHLEEAEGVEIVGEASDGLEAVDAIRELAPDLVFLDIQMPGMTGFEVLEAVGPEAMPPVVFVTAYDEFAVKAFEVEAVDYLLKPYDAGRFGQALDRALRRLAEKAPTRERMERLLETVGPGNRSLQRLVVRKHHRLLLIGVDEVTHLSARENYVEVFTASGSYLIRDTLSRLESRLDPTRFVRVHRSEIVNLDFVKELQPWTHGDYLIILESGEELRLSRRYSDRVLKGV
jgi:two-component system LytT family response regulator